MKSATAREEVFGCVYLRTPQGQESVEGAQQEPREKSFHRDHCVKGVQDWEEILLPKQLLQISMFTRRELAGPFLLEAQVVDQLCRTDIDKDNAIVKGLGIFVRAAYKVFQVLMRAYVWSANRW